MVIIGNGGVVLAMVSFASGAALESIPLIAGGLVIAGLGFGICQPSISALVGNSVGERHFGIASSAVGMASSIGAVSGISVLTAITADSKSPEIFFRGYALGAAFALVAFGASFFTLGRRAARAAAESDTVSRS
jgi:MFS family permease